MAQLDFWYSIGSTYTYLSVMRIDSAAERAGVSVKWCPYNVRHVMTVQNNIPFKDKPEKSAYMWRDIERQAMKYGLSPRLPAPYPIADLPRANRVARLGAREGWVNDYTRATYRRWFEAGQPAGEDPNLSDSLAEIGQDPARVLSLADSAATHDALSAATEEAMERGIFGAPSFLVGEELFWGDDRLEDALNWAKSRA
ncbi:2-hydroxychromene-2-carboxylate isomerase [Primorskyibacter aestuariivivens]|uniref:2-hydroxychromene-2-carboxylate isomerase n=1 Tax=Primorskyibacter aestuariivivens TaxID=1888912 RepID=UPI0023005401|nr:2-hydroxychromene-2-carboxylate isomerase [Primorskyibacter aestuariivivens]MDA7428173.1 2-hydroxychromene-2-carboxylate isomerase [Primorskyibacter aestuariivivens]